jgi:hypothetical protein
MVGGIANETVRRYYREDFQARLRALLRRAAARRSRDRRRCPLRRCARLDRHHFKLDLLDGSLWRPAAQLQLQQFQQHFRVQHRNGEAQPGDVIRGSFQLQPQAYFIGGLPVKSQFLA